MSVDPWVLGAVVLGVLGVWGFVVVVSVQAGEPIPLRVHQALMGVLGVLGTLAAANIKGSK